jgi:hypothetical protein
VLHMGSGSNYILLMGIDLHPMAGCFFFLLLLGLHTIFKCTSWVIMLVATIAASLWTNWCLHCCCVLPSGALLEVSVVRLDLPPISPGGCAEDYFVSYKWKWIE